MATYQIEWKASALRELKRIDRQYIPRILDSVLSLSSKPFPPGVKKLQGSQLTYRIRIGEFRVIYEVYETTLVVEIVRVRHRKDAYSK